MVVLSFFYVIFSILSLLIIAELLTTQNIQAEDLDILGRIKSPGGGSLYERASSVPRTIGLKEKTEIKEASRETSPKFSTNEVSRSCQQHTTTKNSQIF